MFKLRITGDLGFEFWKDIPGIIYRQKKKSIKLRTALYGNTLNPCVYDMYIQHLFSCMLNCPLCFLSQF